MNDENFANIRLYYGEIHKNEQSLFLPRVVYTMGEMSQKIWCSIMVRQSKRVEISTTVEISAQNILGIITP